MEHFVALARLAVDRCPYVTAQGALQRSSSRSCLVQFADDPDRFGRLFVHLLDSETAQKGKARRKSRGGYQQTPHKITHERRERTELPFLHAKLCCSSPSNFSACGVETRKKTKTVRLRAVVLDKTCSVWSQTLCDEKRLRGSGRSKHKVFFESSEYMSKHERNSYAACTTASNSHMLVPRAHSTCAAKLTSREGNTQASMLQPTCNKRPIAYLKSNKPKRHKNVLSSRPNSTNC